MPALACPLPCARPNTHAGDEASCLFVVMSGRLRLLHTHVHPVTGRVDVRVEEEVGRGEAVGVVWTIAGGQHDTTALCGERPIWWSHPWRADDTLASSPRGPIKPL